MGSHCATTSAYGGRPTRPRREKRQAGLSPPAARPSLWGRSTKGRSPTQALAVCVESVGTDWAFSTGPGLWGVDGRLPPALVPAVGACALLTAVCLIRSARRPALLTAASWKLRTQVLESSLATKWRSSLLMLV